MADAKRDNNFVTTLLAVSSVDGVTPVTLYANPTTHRLLVDLAGSGSGTVTSVTSANADISVATGTTTPVLTLNSATLPTVSTIVKRDANANIFANNSFLNTTSTVSAAGTTVLTVASSHNQYLTGSSTQTYQLPDATTLALSQTFTFNNNSSQSLTITNAGAVSQYVIPAGGSVQCFVTSIGSANGSWDFHAMAPATVTWGSGVTGLVMNSVLSTTPAISAGASSATAPSFIPQRGTLTTGYGGDATNLYGIIGGATAFTATTGGDFSVVGALSAGSGAGNGTVKSNGNFDLILQTGNATTGNITIADGANGNITITPNGTGNIIAQTDTLSITDDASSNYIDFYVLPTYVANYYEDVSSGSYIDMRVEDSDTHLELSDTNTGGTGPNVSLYHNSASPAANDVVGSLSFYGEDSAGNKQEYGRISTRIDDTTSTSEDSTLFLYNVVAGSLGNAALALTAGAVRPGANDDRSLGTSTVGWSDLFLAEGGVINWDNGDATLTQVGNDVTLAGASLTARIKPRTGTTTSSATPTINTDDVDFYSLTAQTVDITSFTTNLSGTPTDGQKLWIAITGTAARAITWGATFENGPVALPTTTVTTTRLDVAFIWNAVTSKWRCVASGSTV